MSTPTLPLGGRLYVAVVVACGLTLVVQSILDIVWHPPSRYWLLLAGLTLFSGPFSIRVPSVRASVSVSEPFVFASVLLFGASAATITVALDGALVTLGSRQRAAHRTLFNIAEPAVSVWLSAHLFYAIADIAPLFGAASRPEGLSVALVTLTTSYFLLNTSLTTIAISLESGRSLMEFLRGQASHLALNYFTNMCFVVLLVHNVTDINFAALGIIIPVLVVSYVSSRTAMARVEDANRHLEELNQLYLSTVETLAMAVDAKDQITHGHIRRVQRRALTLARALGVRNSAQLKALEAAALLHDLGKLAVPEHILNKPGRLSPAEFERMKAHASIGAEILSRINFPYPVTPIIRHHHENWDGTGYPDGIAGEAIPLGARILSVVDCFDALTSDRPYRRRLPAAEALSILRTRRGTMYDPRVVDMFFALYGESPEEDSLPADEEAASSPAGIIRPGPHPVDVPGRLPPRSAAALRARLDGSAWFDAIRAASAELDVVTPNCVWALFLHDSSALQLVPVHVSDERYVELRERTIQVGERLSGWVAANRRAIVNSPANLDGADQWHSRPLHQCLSAPLVWEDELVGVLTVYSRSDAPFDDHQTRTIERLASRLGRLLRERPSSEQAPQDLAAGGRVTS